MFSDGSGPHEVCGDSYRFFLKDLQFGRLSDLFLRKDSKFDPGIPFRLLLSKRLSGFVCRFSFLGWLRPY